MAAWEAKYSAEQLADVAYAALQDEANAAIAVAVALAESGGRMTINRSAGETPQSLKGVDRCLSAGPWQINYCPTRDGGTIREKAATSPALPIHAVAMRQVYNEQGWDAWTMFSNGTWEDHRAEALEAVKQVRLRDGVGTDDSVGHAVGEAVEDVTTGPFAAFRGLVDIIGDPRRLGYLLLGTAVAGIGVLLIVKEASPAGIAAGAVIDTVKAAT